MKKIIVLFLIAVLSSSIAYAGIFDLITGMVTNDQGEETPTDGQTSTTSTTVYEQVTCLFSASNSTQTCYAPNIDLSCTGTDSCTMNVMGTQGSKVDIKACNNVGYVIIDGFNETVEVNCYTPEPEKAVNCVVDEATQTKNCSTRTETQMAVKCVFDEATQTKICEAQIPNKNNLLYEQLTCKFLGSTSTHTCYYPNVQDLTCTGTDSCTMAIMGSEGSKVNILACGGVAYVTFDNADETAEFNCGADVKCVFDEFTKTEKCYSTEAAAPVENVKEQVTCKFLESKQLQKCYSEFGQSCEGETGCVMEVIGEKGRKTALKSSCGGYAYILLDGNNEDAEFKCIPREEVTPEQIVGRGFQRAAWECYDKTSSVSQDAGCLPAEVWNKKAELYCEGHCYQDKSKCGVNSFSVLEECYETVITTAQPAVTGVTGVAQQTVAGVVQPATTAAAKPTATAVITQPVDLEKLKEEMKESKEETLFCKDSCPLDGKCYPFGYRKGGKYCTDNGIFKEQLKSEEACDNNFECSTNVCVDGKCVSSGLIQKIISWFTKLFG
ncbi:MAG: hypothetical protein Q7J54_07470 [Candidatus Woesearchaeota archaeon]|nr:hypothetical protein [Candidatus Woesearchaeota archaeon]